MNSIFDAVKAWFRQPFSPGMSAIELFFGVGLIIVIVIFWVFILERIEGEA